MLFCFVLEELLSCSFRDEKELWPVKIASAELQVYFRST
jgi:hypothetical protein